MDLQDRREYSVSLHGNVYGFCPDCNQDISTAKHYCSGLSRKVDSAESQAEIVALRARVAELEELMRDFLAETPECAWSRKARTALAKEGE